MDHSPPAPSASKQQAPHGRPKGVVAGLIHWPVATLAGVRFFSRLQIPALMSADDPMHPPSFADITRCLALSSLLIALPSAFCLGALSLLNVPDFVTAAFTVLLAALLTGALHEDGLGDVADGFGGGGDAERKLAIMKDPRVGTYGVIALCGSLLVRTAALASLISISAGYAALLWIATSVLSRQGAMLPWAILPSARKGGLADSMQGPSLKDFAIGFAIAVVVAMLTTGSLSIFLAGLAALVVSYGMARVARVQIGGHTGDVIGATEQLNQMVLLTLLAALISSLI